VNYSDIELIESYFNGDENAFAEIVNRYFKSIYNFSFRLVGNTKDAEDITQDVFVKVWKNIKKFDTSKNLKTWIFTIARNTCVDYLRKKKDIPISFFDTEEGGNYMEDTLQDEGILADKAFDVFKDKKAVEKALNKISIIQREVITLKYVNEMSLTEVSEILNLSRETVKSHHRRALLKLRDILSAPKR